MVPSFSLFGHDQEKPVFIFYSFKTHSCSLPDRFKVACRKKRKQANKNIKTATDRKNFKNVKEGGRTPGGKREGGREGGAILFP